MDVGRVPEGQKVVIVTKRKGGECDDVISRHARDILHRDLGTTDTEVDTVLVGMTLDKVKIDVADAPLSASDLIDRPVTHMLTLEIFQHVVTHVVEQDQASRDGARLVRRPVLLTQAVILSTVQHCVAKTDNADTVLLVFGQKSVRAVHIFVAKDVLVHAVGKCQKAIVQIHGDVVGQKQGLIDHPTFLARARVYAWDDHRAAIPFARGIDGILNGRAVRIGAKARIVCVIAGHIFLLAHKSEHVTQSGAFCAFLTASIATFTV